MSESQNDKTKEESVQETVQEPPKDYGKPLDVSEMEYFDYFSAQRRDILSRRGKLGKPIRESVS